MRKVDYKLSVSRDDDAVLLTFKFLAVDEAQEFFNSVNKKMVEGDRFYVTIDLVKEAK